MKNLSFIVFSLMLIGLASCKKDTKDPEPTPHDHSADPGTIQMHFESVVDGSSLVFGQKYLNPMNDTFKVSMFKYYISNIVFTKDDNTTYAQSDSYHLIDHSSKTTITITNVPPGNYKAVSFMLGVDSARNNSGVQSGDLDPSKNMFWSWSTGYIMFKLEGTAPKSADPNKKLIYHIGGFGGVNKTQRNYSLSFGGQTANVSSTAGPVVHLKSNVNELFKTPYSIDFSTKYYQMAAGAAAKEYADNYADMIKFDHVSN